MDFSMFLLPHLFYFFYILFPLFYFIFTHLKTTNKAMHFPIIPSTAVFLLFYIFLYLCINSLIIHWFIYFFHIESKACAFFLFCLYSFILFFLQNVDKKYRERHRKPYKHHISYHHKDPSFGDPKSLRGMLKTSQVKPVGEKQEILAVTDLDFHRIPELLSFCLYFHRIQWKR